MKKSKNQTLIMGKRSQRHPARYEKNQSGCMSGFINMFDFRQGRTTQRLLSDRRRASRHEEGAASPKKKIDMLSYPDENCSETDGEEKTAALANTGKPSVKKLIEEEMFSDLKMTKELINGEVEPSQCNSENGSNKKKIRKRIKKIRSRSCDSIGELNIVEKPGSECPCHQKSLQRSGNSLDLENIMEQFCRQMQEKKFDKPVEANVQFNPKSFDISEKLSEAIKLLISQKLLDRKDLELTDFLQELTSDEELLLKFSQDPNSLLTKYVPREKNSPMEEDKDTESLAGFSDGELGNSGRSDKLVSHKRRNFFKRKVKDQGSSPLKNEETSQSSNKIVILKPGPTVLCSPQSSSKISMNKEPNERVRSIFFLAELKRRLKNAIGKEISPRIPSEPQNLSEHDGSFRESYARNSLTKEHFFVERIARVKKGERTDKLKGQIIGRDYNSMPHPISNIYVEAKKHLSEMLSNGDDEEQVSSSKRLPKTLGRILSLPEYNSMSPVGSPRWNREYSFVSAQMRFSTSEQNFENVIEYAEPSVKQDDIVNPASQTMENLEPQPHVSDETNGIEVQTGDLSRNVTDENNDCDVAGGDVQIVEVTEIVVEEESSAFDAHSEKSGAFSVGEDQIADTSEVVDEQRDSVSMNLDCYNENNVPASPLSSPSNSSISKKAEDYESLERPSPVSVLDSLFMDDDISPASIRSQSANSPIRSLQIQFEEFDSVVIEQPFYSKTGIDGNESLFEYIEAVLQASGLNREELYAEPLSSDQLLDPSLISTVEFLPDQLCHDQKELLFDCINEVLTEVYEHFFGSPWVSFIKPKIRPLPSTNHVVREVWKGVNWHITPMPLPRTLDQIVRKDMAKSGSWMDIWFDTESIGFEMGEIILEELMEDVIISYGYQHEENGFSINLSEVEQNDFSMNLTEVE